LNEKIDSKHHINGQPTRRRRAIKYKILSSNEATNDFAQGRLFLANRAPVPEAPRSESGTRLGALYSWQNADGLMACKVSLEKPLYFSYPSSGLFPVRLSLRAYAWTR
jgi:hypothetical protein